MKSEPQKLTGKQSALADVLAIEPTIPKARALRKAGYSKAMALHHAKEVVESEAVQDAVAERRREFRGVMRKVGLTQLALAKAMMASLTNPATQKIVAELYDLFRDKDAETQREVTILVVAAVRKTVVEFMPEEARQPFIDALARELRLAGGQA